MTSGDAIDRSRFRSKVLALGCIATAAAAVLAGVVLLISVMRPAPYVRPGDRSLRTIITAQERFRAEDLDGDGAPDYGNLSALAMAGLLDPDLADGQKFGYSFAVAPSPTSPQFLWMAVANPEHPDVDDRSFVTNHLGKIYYRHGPTNLNAACQIPADAKELSQ